MQSTTFVRLILVLTGGFAYNPQPGQSSNSCASIPTPFDDFVRSFDEALKYRLTSFDYKRNFTSRFPVMSSTVLRSPDRAFLMIQKTSPVNDTFCEFYTLWKDRNGTLNGYYGLHELGSEFSLRIVGFELERRASALILQMCFTDNFVQGYEFELDSASSLDETDFRGKIDLTVGCDWGQLRGKLYTPTPRDVRMVIMVGGVVGAFFLVQLVVGLVKVFRSKWELEDRTA